MLCSLMVYIVSEVDIELYSYVGVITHFFIDGNYLLFLSQPQRKEYIQAHDLHSTQFVNLKGYFYHSLVGKLAGIKIQKECF